MKKDAEIEILGIERKDKVIFSDLVNDLVLGDETKKEFGIIFSKLKEVNPPQYQELFKNTFGGIATKALMTKLSNDYSNKDLYGNIKRLYNNLHWYFWDDNRTTIDKNKYKKMIDVQDKCSESIELMRNKLTEMIIEKFKRFSPIAKKNSRNNDTPRY